MLLLEQTQRVGVREHQSRDLLIHEGSQRVDIDESSCVGGHADRLEPRETNARRVRAVGGVGDQHLGRAGRRPQLASSW